MSILLRRGGHKFVAPNQALTQATYEVRPHRSMSDSSVVNRFNQLSQDVNNLSNDPGNEVKLRLYALFKQATQGPNTTSKPGMLDFVKKAKWDAWKSLGSDLSKEEAMKQYISVVEELVSKEAPKTESKPTAQGSYKTLSVEKKDGACIITFNRPEKFNAFNLESYAEIGTALSEAAKDDSIKLAVVTGAGSYYSAGNDLSVFQTMAMEFGGDFKKGAEKGAQVLEKFVGSFVDFPKPLIALINGPAIGIAVTTLGLFDTVIATKSSTFRTPFPSLGQSPEGCSTYTFPAIMGQGRANEMLLWEKQLTADEALQWGLVHEVLPDDSFLEQAMARVTKYAQLPRLSLLYSKQIIRAPHLEALRKANKTECERLTERWTSEDCMQAVMKFMQRKQSKL